MKYRTFYFYFLHFIIFLFTFFPSFSPKSSSNSYCPNYSLFNLNFLPNNISSYNVIKKEFLYTNNMSLFSDYSFFIAISKLGILSFISQNKTLFSVDLKKKMHKTNFNQTNISRGDNFILPMEGKLFTVKTIFDYENFEELTTPITELVDMAPFTLLSSNDYYFLSNKNYYEIKIKKNNNNKYDYNIKLNKIIFIDYTLICYKDKIQIWNTTITKTFFVDKYDNNNNKNIYENLLIYEDNEILEKNMKEIFGNNYNDFMFLYGYNIKKEHYMKLYDYNVYTHLIKKNDTSEHSIEEKNKNEFLNSDDDDNIINAFDYNNDINHQYEIDIIIYYIIVAFIILCIIILILNNCIYGNIFSFKSLFSKKNTNKINEKPSIEKLEPKEIEEKKETFNKKITEKESFNTIVNYFEKTKLNINIDLELKPSKSKERRHKNSMINDLRIVLQKDFKSFKKFKNSISSENLISQLKENNDMFSPTKSIVSRNSKILKELEISKNKQLSEKNHQTRLEKDFKEITPLKKNIYKNNIVVILKAKHKIDEQLYSIKIKKLSNPIQEQSVIAEAQNMKKIRSKHIVEYITCWIDTSVGPFEYLFRDKNKKLAELNNNQDFCSSKSNMKIFEHSENNFKYIESNEIKDKDDHYIKQLYSKDYLSEDEGPINNKSKINLDTRYYEKKDDNRIKFKKKNSINDKNIYNDDYSIEKKKSENQKDVSDLNVYFFIQMEFCQQITLDKYIKDHSFSKINNKIMYTFAYQLIKSLAKIHEKKIIHANINPKNIFVINENSIKIGDFSSAKEITLKTKHKSNKLDKIHQSLSSQNIMELEENEKIEEENIGESLYLSPEQEMGLGLSKKSDIYSLGLVLYDMCKCFSDQETREMSINKLRKFKSFDEKFKKDYYIQYNLILQMIENDEEKRPSCEELLESKDMQNWKLCI